MTSLLAMLADKYTSSTSNDREKNIQTLIKEFQND